MTAWLRVYGVTLLVFLALDAMWLAFVGGPLYATTVGPLLAERFRVAPALLFYLLHITGIMVLVLPVAHQRGGILSAFLYGAVFGLCTYGTYDLTSQAVMKFWTWPLTLVDMAWGGVVTGLAATAGAWMQRRCLAGLSAG